MAQITHCILSVMHYIFHSGRKTRALRELEMLDQTMLSDLGMTRGALVSQYHGRRAGRCAAF